MAEVENRLYIRGDRFQKGIHATVYETGHPQWVVRESRFRMGRDSLYDGEEASWIRVHEGRENPTKFRLSSDEQHALKHHILVPTGFRQVVHDGTTYLQSFYPRKTTDLERYLYENAGEENLVPLFSTPEIPLSIVESMVDQIAPAVDALVKLRVYHGDILLINTLIDEQTGDLSIIDFGRSAVHTGVKNDGEESHYRYMRGEFLYGIQNIISNYSLEGRFPALAGKVNSLRERHWQGSYEASQKTCQDFSKELKHLISAGINDISKNL